MDKTRHTLAKTLRKKSIDAEILLWKHLRSKQIEGFKFRRQEPIGTYIVDFVCYEGQMIIEVVGGQHSMNKDMDNERDRWFIEQGYKVLRFWNNEVLTNIKEVLEVIRENCLNHPPLVPPIKGGRNVGGLPSREGTTVKGFLIKRQQ